VFSACHYSAATTTFRHQLVHHLLPPTGAPPFVVYAGHTTLQSDFEAPGLLPILAPSNMPILAPSKN
jgi:hypothetical protein